MEWIEVGPPSAKVSQKGYPWDEEPVLRREIIPDQGNR